MTTADHESGSGSDTVRKDIISAATRLFASLGYDGTPIELIAQSAGLDAATVSHLVGGKRDIYLEVMSNFYLSKQAMYDKAFGEFTFDRAGVHRLMDHFLDYAVDNPEVPALWVHRWQSDASDIAELESLYFQPAFDHIMEKFRGVVRSEVDLEYALWTLSWCVHGFCVGGLINKDGRREGPTNPALLQRFRRHFHQLIDRMLELDR